MNHQLISPKNSIRDSIRQELAHLLTPLHQLTPPEGLATGLSRLDSFLLWKGLPKGELSLFVSNPGLGATSLCLNICSQLSLQNKKVAWINSESLLLATHLEQRQIHLSDVFIVEKPANHDKLFFALEELISSGAFTMVLCHLSQTLQLKTSQMKKLKQLASLYKVALVFLAPSCRQNLNSIFALRIEMRAQNIVVHRALHRPTPSLLPREDLHANTLPEVSTRTISLVG